MEQSCTDCKEMIDMLLWYIRVPIYRSVFPILFSEALFKLLSGHYRAISLKQ